MADAFERHGWDHAKGQTSMAKKSGEPRKVEIDNPANLPGQLKCMGGSNSDDWNNILANQALKALWLSSDPKQADVQHHAMVHALIGIAPKDEIEGMIAAQLIASHHASMECYRRAMLREQPFEGRREALSQANKLSRTYATLLEALNRHRGKGQQKVTVEHVHVHEGGQAIVGNVEAPGGGVARKSEKQPRALEHAPGTTLPSMDKARDPVPVASDAKRPLWDARRTVPRRAKGQ